MRGIAARGRAVGARLRTVFHQLRSVRLRVAASAAVVASIALFGGVAWLRGTVYDQNMRAVDDLAGRCAGTLRLRLLRPPAGAEVGYHVQPLVECQRTRRTFDDTVSTEWIDTPFEIVGSDGRRLGSGGGLTGVDNLVNAATEVTSAVFAAPAVASGHPAWPVDRENPPGIGRERVRTPRRWASPAGLVGGRRYLARTKTVVLSDDTLGRTEIVDAEQVLAEPAGTAGYRAGSATTAADARNLTDVAALPTWRPGEAAYLVKVYVLMLPTRAENASTEIDRSTRPVLPIAVLVIAAVAWSAADQALRTVERMRAQVAAISTTALDRRLPVPGSNDQIARLAATFNDTLDRLDRGMRRQRQFVADAAHELRNPIGGIRAMLELARDHPDRVDGAAAIEQAAGEARRLQRLAEDLLLLARLESRPTTAFGPVDLAALAAAQVADRGRTGAVRVTFRPAATGSDDHGTTVGNEVELDRLLSNLLDNAERHAACIVEVTVRPAPDDPRFLLLTVDDDGAGIPPADRERVFGRFTRLDEARDRDGGGSGLGLAIARRICRHHGGTLAATASPSGGARFIARLPRAAPPN